MNEIFDIVNCEENLESQNRLFRLIESGEGVLFVGSGISRRLEYPSWEGVLQELIRLIPKGEDVSIINKKIEDGELLLAAEIIKNKLETSKFNTAFEAIFSPKEPSHDEFHKLLVNLKFKGFVTTNYDPIIEYALKSVQNPSSDYGIIITENDKPRVHYFLNSIVNVNFSERYQLYLHGKYNVASSTVLSYGDYVEKYDGLNIQVEELEEIYKELISGNIDIPNFESSITLKGRAFRTLHYKAIYPLFVTQRLVFTGFGLRDEYLNRIINDIQDDFNPIRPNHFALFSKNGSKAWTKLDYLQEKKKWHDKGVELVFFEDDDSYNGIVDFFKKLSPECFVNHDEIPSEQNTVVTNIKLDENESLTDEENVEDENINTKLMDKVKKRAEDLKKK